MSLKTTNLRPLLKALQRHYKACGRRDLPWRTTSDPYKILVSEVMLQQTQVERVIPYYKRFIKKFPTAQKLAAAQLSTVLALWQGLGYNRRAQHLWICAKVLSEAKSPAGGSRGRVHLSRKQELFAQPLPGVGPYTRGAVLTFAFNKPEIFIETNIRTVLFHHLSSTMIYHSKIPDSKLLPIVEQLLKQSKMQPRHFYWALMDYGAYLKKNGVRLNARSAHYAKQSKFEGSRRQARAKALRRLLARGASEARLLRALKH